MSKLGLPGQSAPERNDVRASAPRHGFGSRVARRVLLFGVVLACLAAPGLAKAVPPTVVSLTFDDAKVSQAPVKALLASHGMHATFFVNTNNVGDGNALSWAQLTALKTDGNEIAGHTLDHVDLTTVSAAEAKRQVCDDRSALFENGFAPVSFAYPYGSTNDSIKQIVHDCGYSSARGTFGTWTPVSFNAPVAETLPPEDPYFTRISKCVENTTPLSEMEQYVTQAETTGGWVQICFHFVDVPAEQYNVSLADLTSFLNWLAAPRPRARSSRPSRRRSTRRRHRLTLRLR